MPALPGIVNAQQTSGPTEFGCGTIRWRCRTQWTAATARFEHVDVAVGYPSALPKRVGPGLADQATDIHLPASG
jgi:hypothetical protein